MADDQTNRAAQDEEWKQIVEIHFATKSLTLRAEEHEALDFRTFIQPIREERDALEHICRGMSAVFGLIDPPDGLAPHEYEIQQLGAARRHAIRAFFDAADWLGVSIRSEISACLEPYSHQAISLALPDYYAKQRTRINKITKALIECRERKDSVDQSGTIKEVNQYKKLVDELADIFDSAQEALPALEEICHKETTERDRARNWNIGIAIASTVIGALLGFGLTAFFL